MARRLVIAFALAVLGLSLAACTGANAAGPAQPGTGLAWHSPAGAGTPSADAPAVPSPSAPGSPSSRQSPTSSPSRTRTANRTTARGHGPWGAMTTTGSRSVALTFDDGPGPYTDDILDLLDRYHVHATFCVIGRQVASYAAEIRRIVAEGHTLCNHTWDHDEKLRDHDDAYILSELQRTNDAIHAVAPRAKIEYFRNPGGLFGDNTVRIARQLGMKPLMWNVDPKDWASPGTNVIIHNVETHTRPGCIVLSHDGGGDRSQTLAAYQTLLPWLRTRFRLVALPV